MSFVIHPLVKEYPQTKQLQRMQSLWQAALPDPMWVNILIQVISWHSTASFLNLDHHKSYLARVLLILSLCSFWQECCSYSVSAPPPLPLNNLWPHCFCKQMSRSKERKWASPGWSGDHYLLTYFLRPLQSMLPGFQFLFPIPTPALSDDLKSGLPLGNQSHSSCQLFPTLWPSVSHAHNFCQISVAVVYLTD